MTSPDAERSGGCRVGAVESGSVSWPFLPKRHSERYTAELLLGEVGILPERTQQLQ